MCRVDAGGSAGSSPSHYAALQVVDLDELPKATGVVVVGRLGVPKGLAGKWEKERDRGKEREKNTGLGYYFFFYLKMYVYINCMQGIAKILNYKFVER